MINKVTAPFQCPKLDATPTTVTTGSYSYMTRVTTIEMNTLIGMTDWASVYNLTTNSTREYKNSTRTNINDLRTKTEVGVGWAYLTIWAAYAAGEYNLILISNVTEIQNLILNTWYLKIDLNNFTLYYANYNLTNISWYWLQVKNWSIIKNNVIGNANLFWIVSDIFTVDNCRLELTGIWWKFSTYWVYSDCDFVLPNQPWTLFFTSCTILRSTIVWWGLSCSQVFSYCILEDCKINWTFATNATLTSVCKLYRVSWTASSWIVTSSEWDNVFLDGAHIRNFAKFSNFSFSHHFNLYNSFLEHWEFVATSVASGGMNAFGNNDFRDIIYNTDVRYGDNNYINNISCTDEVSIIWNNSTISASSSATIEISWDNNNLTNNEATTNITTTSTADKTILIGNRTTTAISDSGTNTEAYANILL